MLSYFSGFLNASRSPTAPTALPLCSAPSPGWLPTPGKPPRLFLLSQGLHKQQGLVTEPGHSGMLFSAIIMIF